MLGLGLIEVLRSSRSNIQDLGIGATELDSRSLPNHERQGRDLRTVSTYGVAHPCQLRVRSSVPIGRDGT